MKATPSTPRYAITQALAEVTLGSIIHGFHLPLGGHLLSLNQTAILTWAIRESATRKSALITASQVSNTAAFLKAFSPMGKRLTPMLAISAQGSLFALGPGLFGPGVFGVSFGAALSSVWGFAQPLLIAKLLLGQNFFTAIAKLWGELAGVFGWTQSTGMWIIALVILFKALIAISVSVMAWKSGQDSRERYLIRLEKWASKSATRNPSHRAHTPLKGALWDIANPVFLISLFVSVSLFFLNEKLEWTAVITQLFRGIGAGFLMFWALRAIPASWYSRLLARFPTLQKSVNQALSELSRT